ncbi:cytidylyltransferase domain-containing protein [Thermoproteota archaeon]
MPVLAIIDCFKKEADISSKEISGKTLLELIIERLRKVKEINRIVLAVPDNANLTNLYKISEKEGVALHIASGFDFYETCSEIADKENANIIVRIKGTDIFIDPETVDNLIGKIKMYNSDYVIGRGFPRGVAPEIITIEALQKILTLPAKNRIPANFSDKLFNICFSDAEGIFQKSGLKLKADHENFSLLEKIYEELYDSGNTVDTKEAISLIEKHSLVETPFDSYVDILRDAERILLIGFSSIAHINSVINSLEKNISGSKLVVLTNNLKNESFGVPQ